MAQPQLGSRLYEMHDNFEMHNIPIPETDMFIKRVYFVRCSDPETREFQYRFLARWANYVEEIKKLEAKGHLTSTAQTPIKLRMILEVIAEIKSERGRSDQLRYSNMSPEELKKMWEILQTFKYGASL